MALLTLTERTKRLKYLGFGGYSKKNVLRFQKKAFPGDEDRQDSVYGKETDMALRHFYNVKKCAPNFKPEEFKCECGGKYCSGYPNYMKAVELRHLQSIRSHFKKPMKVTCGLRCKPYNDSLVGSIPNSLHLVGRACDFYIEGVTDTYNGRVKAIKWIKKLPNHHYTYGWGIDSNGYAYWGASYMGNALHTDVNKAPKTKPNKKSKYYSKTTMIGEAACNEKGSLQGGKAGDQAKEVRIRTWYNGGWKYTFRAKDPSVRLKIAQAAIDACGNANIGYDTKKPDRYSAWDLAEANGHNIKGINKKCETTCSQLVSMCMRAAGISKKYARRHYDIATETKYLPKCPDFYMYKGTPDELEPGDIQLNGHHTIIIAKSPYAK